MTERKKKETKPSGHKLLKEFRVLSHRILYYANRGVLRSDFMREVSTILMDFSGCDEVELRLKAHVRCYRFVLQGCSKRTSCFEVMNYVQSDDGEIIACYKSESGLEHLCRDIVTNNINHSLPFFTKGGSFWTGNSRNLQGFHSKLDSQGGHYDLSKSEKYNSLALIPLVDGDEKIGLLQLKSKQKDYFTEEAIEFYEDIAKTLVVAQVHRLAQIALRERVKELTCLYGISRLAERPEISLEKILQGIVELLPPAWLHPEITCARIILDGNSHTTRNFKEGVQRQKADIIIDGEYRGVVEVIYTVEKHELDEGPFLKEERILINAIAKELALIIERREAAEEKSELQEQLRHADRLATIGQLVAGVAHELNEPLTNILGFAQLTKKRPELPVQAQEDIEKIVTSSLHAREVIKKLMIFARQMPPRKTKVNVNKIIEEGLYFLESRCIKEGIKVVRSLSPDLPKITADPAQLTQVLVNLVVNAIQAMEGGGNLTIKTTSDEKHISLVIEDSGVGMSKDVLKKIFIPFFTTKEIGKGTGLGLPVVHGIISSHGGKIEVESEIGRGSTFKIELPITVPQNNRKKDGITS